MRITQFVGPAHLDGRSADMCLELRRRYAATRVDFRGPLRRKAVFGQIVSLFPAPCLDETQTAKWLY